MLNKKIRFLYMALVGIGVAFVVDLLMPPPPKSYNPLTGYFIGIIIAILIWEGNLRIDDWLNSRLPWLKRPGLRLAVQFSIALVYSSLALLVPMKVYNSLLCVIPPEREYLLNRICLFLGMAVSVILLTFEVSGQFFSNWKRSLLEVERYKTENVRAQLQNLKNQVNPHFLFNNLSVLSSLVYKDQDKAAEFIHQLSKVYRYLLDNQQKELVSLRTEMEFIDAYLFLLKIRFDKNLNTEVQLDETAMNLCLPPMALQVLVENGIKHNEVSDEHPLSIRIRVKETDLIVSNTLQRRARPEASSGTGLSNLIARYRYFTDRPVQVREQSGNFEVSLPLLQRS